MNVLTNPDHPPRPLVTFAERLRAGPPAWLAWCGLPEPSLGPALIEAGADAVLYDLQHGALDFAAASLGVAAVAAMGGAAFVRVPVGAFADAGRALDAGAVGVVAPMVNSVGIARAFAAAMKYPPLGERSWGPHRALPLSGLSPAEHVRRANGFTLAIAMIETREALEALDAILAVEGIDGVLVGPSDLSIALSRGTLDPGSAEVDAAMTRVAAAARAAGKVACAYCHGGARAGELAARGFHLLSFGSDLGLMKAGAKAEVERARGALGGDAATRGGGDPARY